MMLIGCGRVSTAELILHNFIGIDVGGVGQPLVLKQLFCRLARSVGASNNNISFVLLICIKIGLRCRLLKLIEHS